MAESIWVLMSSARIPELHAVQGVLQANQLPLDLDAEGSWSGHEGWLPMKWRGEESGCEVEWERKLRKKDAGAAARTGVVGADTAVVVTARGGWESYQSAVSFAAALAITAGGAIADGDGYVASEDALEWVFGCIASADAAVRRERQASLLRDEIAAAGNLDHVFENLLARLVGVRAKLVPQPFDGSLGLHTSEGPLLRAAAWRLEGVSGKVFDHTRRPMAMARLLTAMGAAGEAPGPEERRAIQTLESELRSGEVLDGKDADAAFAEIGRWPAGLTISELAWERPSVVRLRFEQREGVLLVLDGRAPLAEVTVAVSPLRFVLNETLRLQ